MLKKKSGECENKRKHETLDIEWSQMEKYMKLKPS